MVLVLLFLALCFSTYTKKVSESFKPWSLKGRWWFLSEVFIEKISHLVALLLEKWASMWIIPGLDNQAKRGPREGVYVWSRVQEEVMGHQAQCHRVLGSFSPKPKSSPPLLHRPWETIPSVGSICSSFGLQDLNAACEDINSSLMALEL